MEPARKGPGRPPRNGGSVAAVQPPQLVPATPEPPTATQQLAALDALRHQHGGLPLPMPANIHGAAISLPVEALGGDGLHVPNRAMKEAERYFAELAEIGSPNDLGLAWTMWRAAEGIANPKPAFEVHFNELKNAAGRRFNALWQAAQREATLERERIEHRDHAVDLRRQIADAECEVARLKVLLARHEAMRPAA